MKNKKLKNLCLSVLLLMQLLMLTLLSGCQLAIENAEENDTENDDRLIGVFVTTKALEDVLAEAQQTEEFSLDVERDAVYLNRVYADKTSTEDGLTSYAFTGMDGIGYFNTTQTGEDGDVYLIPYRDDCLVDAGTTHKVIDGERGMEMESVIHFLATDGNRTFLFNPVYQTEDDRVYVTPSIGWSGNDGYTNIMEQNRTLTVNGESESIYTKVTTRVEGVQPAEKYVLVHMDEKHQRISSVDYAPDSAPSEMTIPAETAYLILESYRRDLEGNVSVDRELVNQGEESFATFRVRDNGICIKEYTCLTWR